MKEHWTLDPSITFLNHGSFGATPRAVLEKQAEYRAQMEREPVRFFNRELEPLLDSARATLASFLGAEPEGLAFVPNATAGVNAVLRSLDLDKFDELLVTTQEYNASRNALDYVAGIAGAKVVVVDVPFPIDSPDVVVERVLAAVTDRTRLFLVDHITSQTALILPVERLVRELASRGVDTLIDGAHAPGMLPLNLRGLGAAYYTGNLHKWVCAPKGAAFLYVRENRRRSVHPVSISHGASSPRVDRSRFLLEFDWTGTFDPTAWLSVPAALSFFDWPEVMERNRSLALRARDVLCSALSIPPPAPDDMLGSMAAVPLPDGPAEALQDALLFSHAIEVPVVPWPAPPKRVLRVSAPLYNELADYEKLADALRLLWSGGLQPAEFLLPGGLKPAAPQETPSLRTIPAPTGPERSMKMTNRWIVAGCVALLAACGGSENTTGTPETETTGSVQSPQQTSSATATTTGETGGTVSNTSDADKTFVTSAGMAGLAEVQYGNLALQKSENADVRAFAQRMVTDHGKSNAELANIATVKGLVLPAELAGKHQQGYEHLQSLGGGEFDRAYMQHMVGDHQEAVTLFQNASTTATDADLRGFATKTLPTLQEHLTQAQGLAGKL